MTPAINSAKKAKIKFKIHQYEHEPAANSYGEEAAQKLETAKPGPVRAKVQILVRQNRPGLPARHVNSVDYRFTHPLKICTFARTGPVYRFP